MRVRNWKYIGLILIFTSFICIDLMAKDVNDFEKLTLQITAPDQNFLPYEPLPITFTLSNNNKETIEGHSMLNPGYGFLEIYISLDNLTFEQFRTADWPLVDGVVGDSVKPLEPGFITSSRGYIYFAYPINIEKEKGHYLFEKPGIYYIKSILKDGNGQNTIESNIITVKVIQPEGEDSAAYEFLKDLAESSDNSYVMFLMRSFGRDKDTKSQNIRSMKEKFLSNFPNSHYARYVYYSLGSDYCLGVDKGIVQGIRYLERASGFEDFFLAEKALNKLVEVSVQQEKFENAKKYLETLKKRYPGKQAYYEQADNIDKLISDSKNRL